MPNNMKNFLNDFLEEVKEMLGARVRNTGNEKEKNNSRNWI